MSTGDVFVNYYEVLEVARNASDEQIRDGAKKQRRVWAKRQGLADQDRRHEAELRMKHIADGERTLLDKGARARYDAMLANYRPPLPTAGTGGGSTAESWLDRVDEFLRIGDAHSANYAAREATTLTPQNDAAWSRRAQTSLLLGNPRDAVFELNEALRINPRHAEHHFDLGTIYESSGEYTPALRSFENAAALEPNTLMYRVAQASVHIQADQAARALAIMEEVVRIEPNNGVFNSYLAMALHDVTIGGWTKLKNGTYVITNGEQVAPTKANMDRALALRFDDSGLRHGLQGLKDAATDAESMKFRMPGGNVLRDMSDGGIGLFLFGVVLVYGFWLWFPMILFAVHPAVGVLATVASFGLLYKLAYRPKWHWQNKDSAGLQVR